MKQETLRHFDLPWLPVVALVIFVVCFLCYAYWTYKKGNRSFFEKVSLIPLEDPQVYKIGKKYE